MRGIRRIEEGAQEDIEQERETIDINTLSYCIQFATL